MSDIEKTLDSAIAYFQDILDNPDRVIKFNPPEHPPVSIKYLKSICKHIGCSGVDPWKCPGDPNCHILQEILK